MSTTLATPAFVAASRHYAVACSNVSSVLSDDSVQSIVNAMNQSAGNGSAFATEWGVSAECIWLPKGHTRPSGAMSMQFGDDAVQAGVLGFHTVTEDGHPAAFILAKVDLQAGLSVPVTASHELYEMLVDPEASQGYFLQTGDTTGTILPKEVADPVEDDSMAVPFAGELMSNWVTRRWFEDYQPSGVAHFDYAGHLTSALTIGTNGYMALFQVPNTGGWQDVTGANGPSLRHQVHGPSGRISRRARRLVTAQVRAA